VIDLLTTMQRAFETSKQKKIKQFILIIVTCISAIAASYFLYEKVLKTSNIIDQVPDSLELLKDPSPDIYISFDDLSFEKENLSYSGSIEDNITESRFGNSFRFDGENDYLSIKNSNLNYKNQITISFWIFPEEMKEGKVSLISKGVAKIKESREFQIYIADKKLHFTLSDNGDNIFDLQSNANIKTGKWTHIACINDGNEIYIYINGEMDAKMEGPEVISNSHSQISLGKSIKGESKYYKGKIDEVYIYPYATEFYDKSIRITTPNIVRIGEGFKLHIGIFGEDGYPLEGNFSDIIFPSEINDSFSGLAIEYNYKSDEKVASFPHIICLNSGIYNIKAIIKDKFNDIIVESTPIECMDSDPESYLYWGDMHWHTELSDGRENGDYGYNFAKDISNLDFAGIADHAWRLEDPRNDWQKIVDYTNLHHQPGEFVTILGHEWAGRLQGEVLELLNIGPEEVDGHFIVRYPGDGDSPYITDNGTNEGNVPIVAYPSLPYKNLSNSAENIPDWTKTDTIPELWKKVHTYGGTMTTHHINVHRFDLNTYKTKYLTSEFMPYVEIYSKWGSSEYYNNVRPTAAQDRVYDDEMKGKQAQYLLEAGYMLGFVGGSDSHSTTPGGVISTDLTRNLQYKHGGVTACYAPDLKREVIWDALINRLCYASTTRGILIHFYIDGHNMGEKISVKDAPKIDLTVAGLDEFEIRIIKNRKNLYTKRSEGNTINLSYTDKNFSSDSWYYVKVIQDNGEMAWSSPIWIQKEN